MRIIADLSKGTLLVNGAVFQITCNVRSLSNKQRRRKSDDVARSIPDYLPYDPRPFLKGLWEITAVEWQDKVGFDAWTYGPVKIRTNAWCWVNVWELDKDGDYLRETERRVKDGAYHLHYSSSSTTLGCIRLASPKDARAIAGIVQGALKQGEPVELEVV